MEPLSERQTSQTAALKANSHITCRAHDVPLPCRAAKGLECVFPIWFTVRPCLIHTCHAAPMTFPCPCCAAKGLECVFPISFTQCGRVWFTLAMPRPCHSRPCHSSQGHDTAWPSREGLWANCPRSASSSYHAEFHEVIRRIPVSDAGGQCETKHRLSWTRKRVVAAHYKKDDVTLLD